MNTCFETIATCLSKILLRHDITCKSITDLKNAGGWLKTGRAVQETPCC